MRATLLDPANARSTGTLKQPGRAVYDHNNRPAQALNDRVCYLVETPDVTIK